MPVSNRTIKPYHYVILVLWLVSVIFASRYFFNLRLVTFDPQNKLTGLESGQLVEQVTKSYALSGRDLRNTIVHFTSPDCFCDEYSREHKAAIDYQAKLDGFKVLNLELDFAQPNLIPSSPAILVLDDLGELLYLGPYSIGLACAESNGFIELALANYKKGFNSNLVVNQATGCYCNT